jgi:hypothetical protein
MSDQPTGNLLAARLGGGAGWYVAHILFVNGCADSPRLPAEMKGVFAAPAPGATYWGGSNGAFVQGATEYFHAPRGAVTFTNEAFGTDESPEVAPNRPANVKEYRGEHLHYLASWDRRELGRRAYKAYWGKARKNFGIADLFQQRIAVVTHSMGAAYSHGLMDGLAADGFRIAYTVHINPFQAGAGHFRGDEHGMRTAHVQSWNDPVVWIDYVSMPGLTDSWERIKARGWTPGAQQIIRKDGPDDIRYAHAGPIGQGRAFWYPKGAPAAFGLASAGATTLSA